MVTSQQRQWRKNTCVHSNGIGNSLRNRTATILKKVQSEDLFYGMDRKSNNVENSVPTTEL